MAGGSGGSAIDAAWAALAAAGRQDLDGFDPGEVDELPGPAARWLRRVVPEGAALRPSLELEMTGRIRLGPRWLPFDATQIITAGVGFVWKPVVGGRLLRFVGADVLAPGDARMEFRLHGLVPVARASGPDTARSAAGRLAAETVAWLPAATLPRFGAEWRPLDDDRATVSVPTPSGPVDVTVTVAADGRLVSQVLQRWSDTTKPPSMQPFGGDITGERTTGDGIRIAGSGTVGWQYGTPGWDEGRFFEFTVNASR